MPLGVRAQPVPRRPLLAPVQRHKLHGRVGDGEQLAGHGATPEAPDTLLLHNGDQRLPHGYVLGWLARWTNGLQLHLKADLQDVQWAHHKAGNSACQRARSGMQQGAGGTAAAVAMWIMRLVGLFLGTAICTGSPGLSEGRPPQRSMAGGCGAPAGWQPLPLAHLLGEAFASPCLLIWLSPVPAPVAGCADGNCPFAH